MRPITFPKYFNTPFKQLVFYCRSWSSFYPTEDIKVLEALYLQIDPEKDERWEKLQDAFGIKTLLAARNIPDDFLQKLIDLLIKKGADLSELDYCGNVLEECISSKADRAAYFDKFLTLDVDVNAQNTFSKRTPLHVAVDLNKPDYVKKLLATRKVNLSIKDKDSDTAYSLMCKKNTIHPEIKQALDAAMEQDRLLRWQTETHVTSAKDKSTGYSSGANSLYFRKGYISLPETPSDSIKPEIPIEPTLLGSLRKIFSM